ncbi:MAG: 2-dehydropantoate 2-reductase [Litorimonas sp.]
MTKMVILGAGSIGCWIGGHLIAGGAQVTLIGRARYAQQIAEHGLRLTHFEREPVVCTDVDFQTDAKGLRGAEIIALCVKSQDTAEAAQQILKHAPNAVVVSFQNGIRNPETLREVLPPENVVPAIVPFNVTPTQPGAFHCGTAGDLVVDNHAGIEELVSALEAAGQGVRRSDEIVGDQWAKMIVNLNNGLNTLSGGTLRDGLLQRDYRRALAECVEEAMDVAKANNVTVGNFNGRSPSALVKTLRLPDIAYRVIMQTIVKIDAKARSSMLDDLEAGRQPEIDYLQGEIVKRAEMAETTAPNNAAILEAVEQAFEKGMSPKFSGKEIYTLLSK